ADILADDYTFQLMELHLAPSCDLLVAVAHAGKDDANRLCTVLTKFTHGANLPRRSVRPQNHVRISGVERVLHIASRVMLRDVKQGEVHLVGFDISAAINLKAHITPDAVEFAEGLGAGMQATCWVRMTGQGNIQLTFFKVLGECFLLHKL